MTNPSVMAKSRPYPKAPQKGSEEPQEAIWRPVPGFPEYEVTEFRQVRRCTTKAPIFPYPYRLRAGEGEFVEFWVDGRKHIMSLESIMVAVWPIKKAS